MINLKNRIELLHITPPSEVATIEEIKSSSDRDYEIIQHDYSPPYKFGGNPEWLENNIITPPKTMEKLKAIAPIQYSPYYKLTIENLRVMGNAGVMVTNDNRIIYESIFESGRADWDPIEKSNIAIFKDGQIDPNSLMLGSDQIPAPQYINATVTVLPCQYDAYGHQLGEIFANYLLMRELEHEYIYCKYNEFPVVQELFDLIGFPKDRIISATPGQQIIFKRANVILPKWQTYKQVDAQQQFLKEIGLSDVERTEKIYVLRDPQRGKQVNMRYIINRSEVEKLLKQRGFISVMWEDLSMREKIETMSRAKFIVQEYSSGFLHSAFWGSPTVNHLLILPPYIEDLWRVHPDYSHNYPNGLLFGYNAQPPEFFNEEWRHRFEIDKNFRVNNTCFTVNIDELDSVITEMERRG